MNSLLTLGILFCLVLAWNLTIWFLAPDYLRYGNGLDIYCITLAWIGAIIGGLSLL